MALKFQNVTIDLSRGGLNTGADPKALTPGELILLENGVFDKRGAVNKRKGKRSLGRGVVPAGSFTDGRALGVRGGNELVTMGAGSGLTAGPNSSRVFARDSSAQAWVEVGNCNPVECEVQTVSPAYQYHAAPNACIVDGKYAVYTAETRTGDTLAAGQTAATAHAVIVELATGVHVWEGDLATTQENSPKPVAIGTVALIFVADDGGPNIAVWLWNSATPATAPTLVGAVVTDLKNLELWDVCEQSATLVNLVWANTGNTISSAYFDSAGAQVGSTVDIAEQPVNALACFMASDGTDQFFCVAYQLSGGTNIRVRLNNITQSTVFGPATLFSTGTAAYNITGARETDGANERLRIFVDRLPAPVGVQTTMVISGQMTFAAAATGGTTTFWHVMLASKAFYANTRANVLCVYGFEYTNQFQPTYFLKAVDAAGAATGVPTTMAKILPSRAAFRSAYQRTTATGSNTCGLPPPVQMDDGRWLIAGLKQERLIASHSRAAYDVPSITKSLCGMVFDLSHVAPSVSAAGSLFFGGGYLGLYDGGWQESGFHVFPDVFSVTNSATAGGLVGSTLYNFRVVAEWTDRHGNLHRSSPSTAVAHTTGVGIASVTVSIHSLAEVSGWTAAQLKAAQVRIHVLRTVATTGTVYYKTATSAVNDPSIESVTVNSGTVPDADLTSNEILYTEGGVIENIGPPAMHSIAAGRNRMAGIPSDDRTAWWYTKQKEAGIAFEWSDLLTGRIEADGDNTAIAFNDDKWIIFKELAVYIVSGDGPNSLGVGDFNQPYRLPGDIGCVDRVSVLNTPVGIMFKSHKGFHLLPGGGPQYIGAPVEKYNAYTVVAALLEEDAHRAIFFLSEHQPALVYDYESGQWGTFTDHDAVAAVVWQGSPAFVGSDGKVHVQGSDFLDDGKPYGLKLGLGWITMAGALGWQRFRKVGVLCDWKSPHTLMLRVYYRRGEVPEDRGTVVTGEDGVEAVRFDLALNAESVKGGHLMATRLPHQKATAIRLEIEDTDPTGEDYTISAIMLEVGVRPGFAHLPAAKVA